MAEGHHRLGRTMPRLLDSIDHPRDQLRYENANRFYLRGDHFHRVYVYMSGTNLLKIGDA